MRILLTNDDGHLAPGLLELASALQKQHELLVVAPDEQRSACSHSMTMFRPLVLSRYSLPGCSAPAYSLSGTPVDCVKVALNRLYDADKPDLVLSGINKGANLGTDVLYSGTVAAAVDAGILGLHGVAVSVGNFHNAAQVDYQPAVEEVLRLLALPVFSGEPRVINLNLPPVTPKEIAGRVECSLGNIRYEDHYKVYSLPDGSQELHLQVGQFLVRGDEPGTDVDYHFKNYITYTQLHRDLTDKAFPLPL